MVKREDVQGTIGIIKNRMPYKPELLEHWGKRAYW